MSLNARTSTTLARVGAVLFAMTAILSFVAAYEAQQNGKRVWGYLARATSFAVISIVLTLKSRSSPTALQADEKVAAKDSADANR